MRDQELRDRLNPVDIDPIALRVLARELGAGDLIFADEQENPIEPDRT
jgi:hypothetical protein